MAKRSKNHRTLGASDQKLDGKAYPPLRTEDAEIWTKVARTTEPLRRPANRFQHHSTLKEEMADLMRATVSPDWPPKKQKNTPAQPPPFTTSPTPKRMDLHHPIEDRVHKHLAKGRLSIDGRIDLHGMTQDAARHALLNFLEMAQASGHRVVLVITGKGNMGQGVLRRMVPVWFELTEYRRLVNGYRQSHVSHGGEGALYVRIRKRGSGLKSSGRRFK
ncbi:MAG: Smr/MutS family protein [Pseudomonadota bacterium]